MMRKDELALELRLVREHRDHLIKSNEGLKGAIKELTTLQELGTTILSTHDLSKILESFLDLTRKVIEYDTCLLFLIDEKTYEFTLSLSRNLPSEVLLWIEDLKEKGLFAWVINKRKPTIVRREVKKGKSSQIDIILPLLTVDKAIGVFHIIASLKEEAITQQRLNLLSLLGSQTAIAVENTRLYQSITEKSVALSQIKEYMSNILDSMAQGVFVVDMEDKITLFNKSAEMMFNLSALDLLGSSYQEKFPEGLKSTIKLLIDKTKERGNVIDWEVEQSLKDGLKIPLGISASLLTSRQKEFIGVVFVCRDLFVTREIIRLRELDQLKTDFTSRVSHDLRTPLGTIKAAVETILEVKSMDKKTKEELLEIVDNEVDRLDRLVEDLLDLQRLESGRAELNLQQADIGEVIREAVQTFAPQLDKPLIKVKLGKDLPSILLDRDKIREVIINLITNSLKYSPGKAEIKVRASKVKKGVKVEVIDQGIGIPVRDLPFIFDKFYRVNTLAVRKTSGTGLGLSICKYIIEMHKGEIKVRSKEEEGSRFSFVLPG